MFKVVIRTLGSCAECVENTIYPVFTCSNSLMEASVKSVSSLWNFTLCSGVSIVDFEKENAGWHQQWHHFVVVVNFEHVQPNNKMFIMFTLNLYMLPGKKKRDWLFQANAPIIWKPAKPIGGIEIGHWTKMS